MGSGAGSVVEVEGGRVDKSADSRQREKGGYRETDRQYRPYRHDLDVELELNWGYYPKVEAPNLRPTEVSKPPFQT
jgi:hypothetical protein